MSTTIYFIRHGQKENLSGDPTITSLGIKQAQTTAKYFSDFKITSIYASPYRRTVQTAQIIAKQFDLPVNTDYQLKERLNWGDRKNESFAAFWNEWQKTDLDRSYRPTYGKSSFQTGEEVKHFIDNLPGLKENQSIIIVTHGGTIGDFLRVVFSEEKLPHLTNKESGAKYLDILECSITEIEVDNKQYSLKKTNFTDHLK